MKIAGAPISWGVCEVPGWGYQMSPERVLTEMKEIGLTATEFGPAGWLPTDPAARAEAGCENSPRQGTVETHAHGPGRAHRGPASQHR